MNENNPLICVIDDESAIRESLTFLLRSAPSLRLAGQHPGVA